MWFNCLGLGVRDHGSGSLDIIGFYTVSKLKINLKSTFEDDFCLKTYTLLTSYTKRTACFNRRLVSSKSKNGKGLPKLKPELRPHNKNSVGTSSNLKSSAVCAGALKTFYGNLNLELCPHVIRS